MGGAGAVSGIQSKHRALVLQRFKSSVYRRYNDFVVFHEMLLQKFPYRMVPALPPKRVLGGKAGVPGRPVCRRPGCWEGWGARKAGAGQWAGAAEPILTVRGPHGGEHCGCGQQGPVLLLAAFRTEVCLLGAGHGGHPARC